MHGARDLRVRLWSTGTGDVYRTGDAMRLRFQTTRDAYVAVIHISPDGALDFLYPHSGLGDGRVRAGRSYSLPASSHGGLSRLSARSGVGYVYVVASPTPLDFRSFRGARGLGFNHFGRYVRGDPFYALEVITEQLVRDFYRVGYATDLMTYYVGGRHSYPSYACYDRFSGIQPGYWYTHYRPCSSVQRLLTAYPGYYHSHRFRGDRRAYRTALRQVDSPFREHEYKESPARRTVDRLTPPADRVRPEPARAAPLRAAPARPEARPQADRPAPTRAAPARPQPRAQPDREETRRERPQLERRRPDPPARPQPQARPRPDARPQPSARPQRDRPSEPEARPAPPQRTRPAPPQRGRGGGNDGESEER